MSRSSSNQSADAAALGAQKEASSVLAFHEMERKVAHFPVCVDDVVLLLSC